MADSIIPDNPNWHRHKNWCQFYRERWYRGSERDENGELPLYQIICLQNTPPETEAEQAQCMKTRSTCWRLQQAARAAKKRAESVAR